MTLACFSAAMRDEERDLKRFMYANLYHHPRQLAAAASARVIVAGLFEAYREAPTRMAAGWHERIDCAEPWRSRHIADYIAGMTDRYAIARYREVVSRSEERRVGKESVSTCRSRWSPDH